MSAVIHWFRRDLRLTDNPALAAAIASGYPVVCAYVHAPDEEGAWRPGAASDWWLHHSLLALDADLRRRGSALVVRKGPSAATLLALASECGATQLTWNRLYEPALVARDAMVKQQLCAAGLDVESCKAALLFEPWELQTGSGGPYRVFTPYWRKARSRLEPGRSLPAPARMPALNAPGSLPIEGLRLLPRVRWDAGMALAWTPGEAGAQENLDQFLDAALAGYASERDRPDHAGTSRLSPHLHYGEISPRQVVQAIAARGPLAHGDAYLRELGWRDFSHHLLFHYPRMTDEPLNAQFARFPWAPSDPAVLAAWRNGRTGVPLVDAGMRELWATGWMHNRVRMVVASFLCKNLRLHWREGARWFWDTLVDADLANNTQGWQWSAGSGADAAPYFRIFNPVSQGERFDPRGDYVRRWVPELARVPAAAVHAPWTLRPVDQAAAGIACTPYAHPIVDLAQSRAAALAAYQQMRAG
jgi:deoxyribodipyrimidine photo-lyase